MLPHRLHPGPGRPLPRPQRCPGVSPSVGLASSILNPLFLCGLTPPPLYPQVVLSTIQLTGYPPHGPKAPGDPTRYRTLLLGGADMSGGEPPAHSTRSSSSSFSRRPSPSRRGAPGSSSHSSSGGSAPSQPRRHSPPSAALQPPPLQMSTPAAIGSLALRSVAAPLMVAVGAEPPPGVFPLPGVAGVARSAPVKAAASAAKPRRNHTKDIDDIQVKLAGLLARDAEREELVDALRREASVAQSLLGSFQSIRQAHEREGADARGKDLQACLLSAVLCRLRRCPPSPRGDKDGERVKLVITHDCSREAFTQFVRRAGLEMVNGWGAAVRTTCVASVDGPLAVLSAVGVPAELTSACRTATFVRRSGNKVRRTLVHRHVDGAGKEWFVLGREEGGQRVRVAARETEEFDASIGSHLCELAVRLMDTADMPDAPTDPSGIVWKANNSAGVVDGAPNKIGKVTLTLPVHTEEGHGTGLSALL